jgi:hypothetical protein
MPNQGELMKWIQCLFVILVSMQVQANAAPKTGKYFDRIMFVIFENTNYSTALQQPFFKHLALTGANFTNFLALTHPSQGNYIALTSGDLNGVGNDGQFDVDAQNIVDLLEAKGLTWKVYAEEYPENCFVGMSSGGYVRKHNPFISYVNIQKNPARCANIVNANQFDTDAANGNLPNYIFYIPNIRNDGHNTGATFADSWYSKKFGPYFSNPQFMENTAVVSTFDESGLSTRNQIYTSIIGPMIKPGNYSLNLTTPSLLRLVEDNWSLPDLGKQDRIATPIEGIWQ